MDKVLSDYPTATIAQLCLQYAEASDALFYASNEEVHKRIRADLNVIFKEIKRRDERYATLQAELTTAKAKVAALYAELEKAQQINFDLIETIAQLSEKLTLEADDGMTEADWQMAEEDWQLTEDEIEI